MQLLVSTQLTESDDDVSARVAAVALDLARNRPTTQWVEAQLERGRRP